MIIEQTVTIPADHRILLDLPFEIPAGRAKITITPEAASFSDGSGNDVSENDAPESGTPISDRLAGCLEGAGDIDLEAIREERLEKYL